MKSFSVSKLTAQVAHSQESMHSNAKGTLLLSRTLPNTEPISPFSLRTGSSGFSLYLMKNSTSLQVTPFCYEIGRFFRVKTLTKYFNGENARNWVFLERRTLSIVC